MLYFSHRYAPLLQRLKPTPCGLRTALFTVAFLAVHFFYVGLACSEEQLIDIYDTSTLSTYYNANCAVRSNGTVWCWGENTLGQCGNKSSKRFFAPVIVSGVRNAISVSVAMEHACALTSKGAVYCWGANRFKQLGHSRIGVFQASRVRSISDARSIATGGRHSCAATKSGNVSCWGGGNALGIKGKSSASPVLVPGLTDAVRVVAGDGHTCALRKTGTVRCWGWNDRGQIGLAATKRWYAPNIDVNGLDHITDIRSGKRHNCARDVRGQLHCWGGDSGGGHSSPIKLREGNKLRAYATGYGLTAGILESGLFTLWNNFKSPAQGYFGIPNVASVTNGYQHSCFLQTDGAVLCWGGNFVGQVGGGTKNLQNPSQPTPVVKLADVVVRRDSFGSEFRDSWLKSQAPDQEFVSPPDQAITNSLPPSSASNIHLENFDASDGVDHRPLSNSEVTIGPDEEQPDIIPENPIENSEH